MDFHTFHTFIRSKLTNKLYELIRSSSSSTEIADFMLELSIPGDVLTELVDRTEIEWSHVEELLAKYACPAEIENPIVSLGQLNDMKLKFLWLGWDQVHFLTEEDRTMALLLVGANS